MPMWIVGLMIAIAVGHDGSVSPSSAGRAAAPVVRAPEEATVHAAPGSTRNGVVFEVLNPGSTEETYSVTCEASGRAAQCRSAMTSVTVAAGGGAYVLVRYAATSAGDGEVALVASGGGGSDRGIYRVLVTDSAATSGRPLPAPHVGLGGAFDVNTPWIEIYPLSGSFGSATLPVSIQWCGNGGTLSAGTRSIVYNQTDVTSSFTYVSDVECGYRSEGTITLVSGGFLGKKLVADICNTNSLCASETATYKLVSGSAPIVSLEPHAGGRVDRSDCVISSAGPGTAFQCGELIATHSMPGYMSMNRERSLTLFYNSGTARVQPVIMADYSLPSGAAVPDSVRVVASVNGVNKGTYRFDGAVQAGGRRGAWPFASSTMLCRQACMRFSSP